MNKLVVLLVALAPAAAWADKATVQDCSKTPTALIGNGGGTYTFKGKCTKISVGGGENTITIEYVDELQVGGGENTITVGTVGTIDVGGADNKITWKKAVKGAKPTLKGQPDKNKISQGK